MTGSILMVAKDCLSLTKKAVQSVANQDIPCDLMVIDNDSRDGTAQWLTTKMFSHVSYSPQRSLSECWNRGLRAFWAAGATEVLVINNDVEILPCTYRLLNLLRGPFVTAVSVNNRGQCKEPTTLIPTNARPHPDFSCFMIRPAVTEQIGYFDEHYYPAYCEDSDYHVRMHRAGINAVCVDLPFYHAAAQTLAHATPAEAVMIRRGADANRQRFRREYGCLPGSAEYEQLFT